MRKRPNAKPNIPIVLRALKAGIRGVGIVSPQLASRWVYHLWFATHRFGEPKRETRWREQAEQLSLPHKYGPLAIYSWGEGQAVLLLHGWNGRGTQMGAFGLSLARAGYRAVAFDAPGHGRTPGKCSTIFRIADAVNTLAKEFGPFKGVVTHSFGAMVVALSLRNHLSAEKVVCINPAAQLEFLIESFCTTLGITSRTRKAFQQRLENHYGADIGVIISAEKNVAAIGIPALVIHDINDMEVPWQQGQRLASAWPNARFMQTHGLGHTRSLRDKQTIQAAIDFIGADP
jgi:pimeloyl-ACP methyl ester carboxylesterase